MALVAATFLSLGAARAQQRLDLPFGTDTPREQQLAVSTRGVPGGRSGGGYGWVAVEVYNPGPMTHEVRIDARMPWNMAFDVRRTVRLAARETSRCFLPMPGSTPHLELRFTVDGYSEPRSMRAGVSSGSYPQRILVLNDMGRLGTEISDWAQMLASKAPVPRPAGRPTTVVLPHGASPPHRGSPQTIDCQYLSTEDLADRPQLLTGFHLVVVVAPVEGLTAERQRVLREFAMVGGALVVDGARALGPGPLRDAIGETLDPEPRDERLGLGRMLVLAEGRGLATAAGRDDLTRWVARHPELDLPLQPGSLGNCLPRCLQRTLEIPGLGDVPVRFFFVIVFGFCLLVGPCNHFWVRKRLGRPLVLLVTVPILGLGFTLMILGYGLLADGVGTKGAVHSLSLLDQRRHEAVVVAGRTLYAGFGPDLLRPQPGTFLASWGFHVSSPRLSIDLDNGTIGGGLVPSRTPTHLSSATVAPARERLRFQRLADGGLALLSDPDFQPSQLVLRDLEGTFWELGAGGRLVRLAAGAEEAPIRRLRGLLMELPPAREATQRYDPTLGHEDERVVAAGRLAPGTYLARVAMPPGFDTLGLEVDWLASRHILLGIIAPEDIVD